jgi:hypothetical protein
MPSKPSKEKREKMQEDFSSVVAEAIPKHTALAQVRSLPC